MCKKRFLDISTPVRCEKGLRREYRIRNYLRKFYVRLRTGIRLTREEVCGNLVACCKFGVLICRQLIEREGDYQVFKKESAEKSLKSDLLVCWLICMWFR